MDACQCANGQLQFGLLAVTQKLQAKIKDLWGYKSKRFVILSALFRVQFNFEV
jgi:hypothetical protein